MSGRRLFKAFHGTDATRPTGILHLDNETFVHVGKAAAIEYDAQRDGKLVKARHEMSGADAQLYISTHGGVAVIVGNFRLTSRGIIDG